MLNPGATIENDDSSNAREKHPGLASCKDASLDSGISVTSRRSSQVTLADAVDSTSSMFSWSCWWRNVLFCLFPFCRQTSLIRDDFKVDESESQRDLRKLADKAGHVNIALDQCTDEESSTDGDPKKMNATIHENQEKARSNSYTKRDQQNHEQNNGSEGRNDTDSGFGSRPVSQIFQFSLAPRDDGIGMSKQDERTSTEDTRVMDKVTTANRPQLPANSTCDTVEKNVDTDTNRYQHTYEQGMSTTNERTCKEDTWTMDKVTENRPQVPANSTCVTVEKNVGIDSIRYQHTDENTMGIRDEGTCKETTREMDKVPETSTCDSGEKVDELSMIVQKIWKAKEKHARSHEELKRIQIHLVNFAAGFLTTEYGGKLTIYGKGVSLYIPPGALPDRDEPQLVYIYIRSSEEGAISKDCREAWVAPQVVCGPPGLVFLEPVRLTMPCLFALDLAKLQVSAYKKKRLTGNTWRGLRDGEDVTLVASDKNVTLLLKHFCDFGCTAQAIGGTSKWMRVAVFVEQLNEEKHRVSLEFFDLTENHLEGNSPQKTLKSSEILLINKFGAVHVTVNGVESSWELSDDSHQSIPSKDILEYQSCTKKSRPQANFFVGSTDGSQPFGANIDVYQDKNSHPRIALHISPNSTQLQKAKSQIPEEIEHDIDQQFLAPYFSTNPLFKRQDCYIQACVSLDNAIEHLGWKQVATAIGVQNQTVVWFENSSAKRCRSPSDMILEGFFKSATDEKMNERLCQLSNLLSGVNAEAKHYIDMEIKAHSNPPTQGQQRDGQGSPNFAASLSIDSGNSGKFYPVQRCKQKAQSDVDKHHCIGHEIERNEETDGIINKQMPVIEVKRNRDSGIGSRPNSSYERNVPEMTLATSSEELQSYF